MKKAIITGITGQDGAYLAEFLLNKGYEVHGLKRRSSLFNTQRIDHIYEDPHTPHRHLHLHYGDLTDSTNLIRIIQEVQPDEIYNLAAQSHVQVSFENPIYTSDVNAMGALRILEAIRILKLETKTKMYQASTSEMFGLNSSPMLSENSEFYPRSPYGISKLFAYWATINYRESYKMFAANGILFNHESPLRGETFVTRKITRATARIALGLEDCIYIGNLNAKRDWGHAKDYVEGMYLMLQQEKPEDFVLATGITTTIRDFIIMAFKELGVELAFKGEGDKEEGYVVANNGNYDIKVNQTVAKVDPKYFRPTEVDLLIGDATKAKTKLGWVLKYDLPALVKEMVASDLELFKKEKFLKENGYQIAKEGE